MRRGGSSPSSTQAPATGAEAAQRRDYPFGSDRAVTGATDLTRAERFTGQPRMDNGAGNARRELYHYGARVTFSPSSPRG